MNSLQKSLSGPMLKHKQSLYLGIQRQLSHGRTNKILNSKHSSMKIRTRRNSLPTGLRVLEKDKCLSLATQRLLTYNLLFHRLPTLTSPRIAAIDDDNEPKQFSNSANKYLKIQENQQIELHPQFLRRKSCDCDQCGKQTILQKFAQHLPDVVKVPPIPMQSSLKNSVKIYTKEIRPKPKVTRPQTAILEEEVIVPLIKVEQIQKFEPNKDSLHTSPQPRLISRSPVGCQEIYLKYYTKDLKKKKTQLIKSTLTVQDRLSKLMTHKAATFECLPQLSFKHVDASQFQGSNQIQKTGSLLVKGSRSFIIHPSPTTQKHSFLTTHIPAKQFKQEVFSKKLKTIE